jgi:hypothetical protein
LVVNCDALFRLSYTEGTDMKVFIADDSVQIRERLIEMLSELPEVDRKRSALLMIKKAPSNA